MANILFAWELGSNFGHITALLPLAKELKQRGHSICFAVRELERMSVVPDIFQFPIMQSPIWRARLTGLPATQGYADILATSGYFSVNGLSVMVAAWSDLYDLNGIDLVVADHAPTALLAARARRISAVAIGTGFVCPPAQSIGVFGRIGTHQMRLFEQRVRKCLQTCNAVLGQSGVSPLGQLSDLFACSLLTTYPELDHYGVRNNVEYLGPIYSDVAGEEMSWPNIHERNILVYLNDFGSWELQYEAFRTLEANILVAAVGLKTSLPAEATNIRVVNYAFPIQALFSRCDLVICHGGHGTVAGALAAARPVLALPTQPEQLMMGKRLRAQQLGNYVESNSDPLKLRDHIIALMENDVVRTITQTYARRYMPDSDRVRLQRIASRIDEIASATAF